MRADEWRPDAKTIAYQWLADLLAEGYVSEWQVRTWVHCDQLTLHRSGSCTYCDQHNARAQEQRIKRGIPFSGEPGAPDAIFRDDEIITRWPGNRPVLDTTEVAQ